MVNNRPFLPVAPAARIYLATKATPSSPYVHDVLITVRHGSTRSHLSSLFEAPQTPANKYNARHSRRFGHYAGCVEKPANPHEGESLPKSHSEAPAEGIQTCPGVSLEEDRTGVLNWNANKKIHIRKKEHLDWNNKIHVRTKEHLNAIWLYLNTITATSRNNSSKFVRRNAFGGMPRCIQVVAPQIVGTPRLNNSSKFIRWNAFGGMPRCIQVVARKLLERLDVRLEGILLYWNTIAARSVNS
ncbi:hypothetical protein B0H14DRAFT_2610079 [Mycena olivaceomarginata]|nr:hypothetical protein B0H14DRAFT_2610079 [Mycena olivaceomarginata]